MILPDMLSSYSVHAYDERARRSTLFIGGGFSHDRRLDVFILVVLVVLVVLFFLVIIVVWISRRHLVADDSEEAPVNRPSRNTFKDMQDHVGSYWTSRHSRTDVTVRDRGRPDMECAMASYKFQVGEIVNFRSVVSRNAPGGAYEVTKQLPQNGREFEYR